MSVSVAITVAPNVAELQDGGGVFFKGNPVRERTRTQLLDDIAVRLGGLAAEEVMLGDRSAGGGGASGSDLHSATLSALTFEASYGLGEGFAYLASEDEDELFSALRLDRFLHARDDKVLAEQFARAKKIVEGHRLESRTDRGGAAAERLFVGGGSRGTVRVAASAQAGGRA